MAKPPIKKQPEDVRKQGIPPGKLTVRQLLDSTRSNFAQQDWARAKAQGAPFKGDKGLTYDTKVSLGKASRAPWGIRFQSTTYAPESFGKDDKGRFPRKWIQYVELAHDFDRTNMRGAKHFRVFCTCARYKFTHHYVLWKNGLAPKPYGKGLQAPDYTRRGTRGVGVCKHLVLALLAINKLSKLNRLPDVLPDSAWRDIEAYWQKVERGQVGESMSANLAAAPDSVRKLAEKLVNQKPKKKAPGTTARDWSERGVRIKRRKY